MRDAELTEIQYKTAPRDDEVERRKKRHAISLISAIHEGEIVGRFLLKIMHHITRHNNKTSRLSLPHFKAQSQLSLSHTQTASK